VPHIIVEYSRNLEARIDIRALIENVHAAVLSTRVFDLGAVRTRAEPRELYVIADGDPDNGFIHVAMHIAPGRDADTRKRVAQTILDAVADATRSVYERHGLGLSVEVREIDNSGAVRLNNLHDRMKAKIN
jgi:5-carboxymethyl-2-hydroxymuconate isomerase